MSRVVLTPRALADLKGIGQYVSQFNQSAARKLVKELRATCKQTIGAFPECGTRQDDLAPAMRCFSRDNYVIFFRGRDPVQILRIVHGSREYSQLDFD
jgi:plasmid stabilization system protein ParE